VAIALNIENLSEQEVEQPLSAPADTKLLNAHYAISTLLLSFYGVAVCPFIETLSIPQLVTPILVAFVLMTLSRRLLWDVLIKSVALEYKISTIYKLDLMLFVAFGALLAAYNLVFFDFPMESGLKLIIGMFSFGWFVSIDVALYNERYLSFCLKKSGVQFQQTRQHFPLTQKFSIFAFISLLVIALTLLLVVRKDVSWIIHQGANVDLHQAQFAILLEFIFVLAILISYLFKIIKSYAGNSDFFLSNQNDTMSSVAKGDLSVVVPVTSNDEYGIMASLTNTMIEELVAQKEEIQQTRDTTILALSSLAETRDNETGAHILRTQYYVKALAQKLSHSPKHKQALTDEVIDLMCKSAPLHDIGKVGIPDKILLKPGKLDFDEFEIMKTHATLGAQAIRVAEEKMSENSFLSIAKEIAETHHEKWDGSGYPNGLKADAIPLSGRLMALADVYDALISKRVYKEAFSHEKAKDIILEGDGKHFDPDVIQAFLAVEDEFLEIADRYKS